MKRLNAFPKEKVAPAYLFHISILKDVWAAKLNACVSTALHALCPSLCPCTHTVTGVSDKTPIH